MDFVKSRYSVVFTAKRESSENSSASEIFINATLSGIH
jgi:hypothetical protein